MKDTIRKLTEAFGPSGYEDEVRAIIRDEVKDHCDSIRVDTMGNLFVTRKGTGKGRRIMLAAHMDEIGVVATHIDEKGFVRFGPIGGVGVLGLLGSRVRFTGGLAGVIGIEKLEENAKIPPMDKLFIDVGARDKAGCPVTVGDLGCFQRPCECVGERIFAKAMDDRIGCAVLVRVLQRLGRTPHELVFVFTVQEEVGLRGATTSGYGAEPEIALAVDVTDTGDTPEAVTMAVSLGAGPAVKIKDGGMLAHVGVRDWLIRTAQSTGIPCQREVLTSGTTDARAIQTSRAGVPAGCLSIPTRYIHTPSEMVDIGDVEKAVELLLAALSSPVDFLSEP